MIISDPSYPRPSTWQLPWLRISLILRTMAGNRDTRDEEIAGLLAVRRTVEQQGWFN